MGSQRLLCLNPTTHMAVLLLGLWLLLGCDNKLDLIPRKIGLKLAIYNNFVSDILMHWKGNKSVHLSADEKFRVK